MFLKKFKIKIIIIAILKLKVVGKSGETIGLQKLQKLRILLIEIIYYYYLY